MEYLSTSAFLRELEYLANEGKSFCFILGAGASVSSDIPSGQKLAEMWLDEMRGDLSEEDYKEALRRESAVWRNIWTVPRYSMKNINNMIVAQISRIP